MNTNPTCLTCRFFHSHGSPSGGAQCRRHAPISIIDTYVDVNGGHPRVYAGYPPTSSYEWCGDHQPKENEARTP